MGFNQQFLLKVSQVPDWERRAIRLSLALIFFTSLGLTLWAVPEAYRAEWGDEVVQSCNWAGATCAVVAASPLIGKVAQLSYERTLGTMMGGLLGFLVYDYGVLMLPDVVDQVFMVCCAAIVGFLSCWLSYKFKLDASMRLFVITFLIVTFGAHNGDNRSALGVALLRTGGIIAGVLLLMGLTIVILPKSATIESLREMKSGLKLLTELNTLVWTSKLEAAAVMKEAAANARAAEAAAATAAAAAAADKEQEGGEVQLHPPGFAAAGAAGGSSKRGSAGGFLGRLFSRPSRHRSHTAAAGGYVTLPDADPEAGLGLVPAAAAHTAPAPAQGTSRTAGTAVRPSAAVAAAGAATGGGLGKPLPGKLGSSRVSQLTRALQHTTTSVSTEGFSTSSSSTLGSTLPLPLHSTAGAAATGPTAGPGGVTVGPAGPTPAASSSLILSQLSGLRTPNPPDPQQQQQHPSYEEVMNQYEVRCEAVLTSVYQSMFKVKDHIALAESEVYLYHFWGHYIFVPMFFNNAFINWLLPNRWRLPVAALEELATSVRVIARLLWIVHLDYSQGFDEVLQALPSSANMTNLLQELGELMSAALGVLVEAFPNKNTILVDSFKKLDDLVDRMLEMSEAQHETLIQDLAANRPKTMRPNRTGSMPTSPAAAAAASSMPYNAFGSFVSRPAAAAVAAADAARSYRAGALPVAASAAAVAAAADANLQALLVPTPPRQVAFVTFGGNDVSDSHMYDSLALEGLSAPVPTESPQMLSPQSGSPLPHNMSPEGDASMDRRAAAPPAAAAAAAASQGEHLGDLLFPLSDVAAGAAAGGSTPRFNRQMSAVEGAVGTPAGTLATSLMKSKFRPYAVMAAVKLQHAAGQGNAATGGNRPTPAAGAAGVSPEQQVAVRQLLNSLSTVSAPDPATADAAALLLQEHGTGMLASTAADASEAVGAAGSGSPGGGAAVPLQQESVDNMSFVKLTRWYSFQFLMTELLDEMDELYCCIRKVLSSLPHGL